MATDRLQDDRNGAPPPHEATLLLHRAQDGDAAASDRLLEIVYEQLRATAGSYFRHQAADHTLQPTALVHEAYLKLIGNPEKSWESRAHFCAVASTAMRHILRDHARAKRAAKRGGDNKRESLTLAAPGVEGSGLDLLALDQLLSDLAETDQRGARIVELHCFGGLSHQQIAHVLGVSPKTVQRSWRRCHAWLRCELGEATDDSPGDTA